jgi:hypothetical protein
MFAPLQGQCRATNLRREAVGYHVNQPPPFRATTYNLNESLLMKRILQFVSIAALLAVCTLIGVSHSRAANIVFYVDPAPVNGVPTAAGDLVVYQYLTNLGHTVTVILDSLGQAADLPGKDLVLISSSVGSGDMAAYSIGTLRTVNLPIISIEPALFDELLMAPNFTNPGGQSSMTITPEGVGHCLAAGKTGSVLVVNGSGTFSFATEPLGPGALVIARGDQPAGAPPAIFLYDTGSVLMDGTTAAANKRIGFFMNATTGTGWNAAAFEFLDSALNYALPLTPIGFSQPPQSITVLEARPATFSCVVTGTCPHSFQWYSNNTPIIGATTRSHRIDSVQLSDNGAEFFIVASNPFSSATSTVAVLTVQRDTVPPMLVIARPDESFVNLLVTFSERVRPEGAGDINNYQLSGGLSVSSATIQPDGVSVKLVATPRQTEATTYTLTVNGVIDFASSSNQIAANSQISFTTFLVQPGFLRRDVFTGFPGIAVADLVNNPAYPFNPNSVELVTRAEGPVDVLDNYGQKIAGYVIPPVSGDYKFYMSSDDGGELWLSSDDNPANATRVAFEPVWNAARDWTGTTRRNPAAPENQSAPIPLLAGVRYYLQALMKEQTGGDNLGVTWQGPSDPIPLVGDLSALSNGVIAAASPVATITITQQPQGAERQQGRRATFTVAASVVPANHVPLYQWQTNGVDIPGANAASYTTPLLNLEDNGLAFRCVLTAAGAQISSVPATLSVIPDVYPPALLSAYRQPGQTTIIVTYSEDMDPTTVVDTFNYSVCNRSDLIDCLSVDSVTPITGSTYLLNTAPAQPGIKYMLTVNDGSVPDLFNNAITAPSNSVPVRPVLRTTLQQDINGYTGSQDTELRSNLPTLASGATNAIWLVDQNDGAGGGTAGPVHSLLRFDNIVGNGPGQLPADAIVVDAGVLLVSSTTDAQSANRIDLHRMLVDWNEATATWNSMVGGISSNDVEAAMAIDVSFVPQFGIPFTIRTNSSGLRDTVKGWVEGTFPNYGWAVLNGTGNDGYRVDSSEHPVTANHPGLIIDYIVPPSALQILPPFPPSSITLNEGDVLTIAFNVRGSEPDFQWFKGTDPVPDANSANYVVAIAHPSDNGNYSLHAENDFPSSVDSPQVSVTVIPDITRPVLVSATGSLDQQTIRLVFSERLDSASANDPVHYTISVAGGGTVNVVSAMLTNGTEVILITDPRSVGVNYTVTVNNVTDIAQTPNTIAAPDNQRLMAAQVCLLAFDATWKFETNGLNLGTSWKEVGYSDSGWPSAAALLGFETNMIPYANLGLNTNNMTLWQLTRPDGTTNITYYLRTSVNIPFSLASATLTLRHVVDDGALFYFNGTEVFRYNMPTGAVTYLTGASSAPGEGVIRTAALTNVSCGPNVIAVEVHNQNITSSDVLFGAELIATVPEFVTCARLSVVNNGNGTLTLSWTGSGTLQQTSVLPGGWADAPDQSNPQMLVPAGSRFYRLRP